MALFPRGDRAAWFSLLLVMMAVVVRVQAVGSVPLWTDEIFTRFYPDAGLNYLWGEGMRAEPTPPLYYTLIGGIERVFGTQPWLLRLPSLFGSLASLFLAWLLGRELFSDRAAALGAALLALAPVNAFYAAEARPYAIQGAAIALALLGLARYLRNRSGLLCFVAGAILAVWLHPTSIVAVAAIDVAALLALAPPARLLPARALPRWVGANVVVAIASLPLLPSIVTPPEGGAATSWIPPLTRWSFESVIGQTLAGPAFETQSQAIAEVCALLLAGLVLLPPWRPGWRAFAVVVLAPAIALAAMTGISIAKPILLSRTLAWLLVPLAVTLGGILSRRHWLVTAAVIVFAAGALAAQLARGPSLKEDWPGLFARMGDLAPPTLVVLAPHSPPGALALYAPEAHDPVRLDDGGPSVPETSVMPRLFGTRTITTDELRDAIAANQPVWLIYRRPEWAWAQRELAGLPPPKRAVQSEGGPNPALHALFWGR